MLVIHGAEARTEFDRSQYPGVSASEIEAVLRYEISQDSDELRRIGAVDDAHLALLSSKFTQLPGR